MAELIREILEKTIKQNKANWAKSLLGLVPKAGKSGLRDLAQKHDVYLYRKK